MNNKPRGIIVFGANGSGKTTLGRELARILNYKHMDIEDYAFEPSEIPFSVLRPREECHRLMLADIEKYRSFVVSSVTGDFGEVIPQMYELAVFISAPLDLRLERIKQRGIERFGDRVREGGDMYEQEERFIDWAATRSLSKIEEWGNRLMCPMIRIDGTADWRMNAADIVKYYKENNP